ncbi:hypothetical protein [Flavobacterium hydatis]|uniref:Uncharacterized protein n=1 Tax=Flavobacterium hydatis TaxID=991 RepID=A0A086AH84_FLAHY|nr:hypothetical protein [Flavobacterium hydatis]KFF16048.1 hypothetical protein IW20_11930 [Flavobacterium hydatis]OXA84498.1 hypothetical protein B0A62_25100 [Flavobacterium hydatis]
MKFEFNNFFQSSKKYSHMLCLLFLLFFNCKTKESNIQKKHKNPTSDTIASQSDDSVDHSSEDEIAARKKYIAFLTDFLNQKESKQSIDTLNNRVEAAMEIYANYNALKDSDFVDINDKLVSFIESKNDLKMPESFYTAGLMESYGYFSIADGHPINHFKKGAKLGNVNCVKYLAIIYFERILSKHNATELCDPVCMSHRGRNYIEESHLASLSKKDILGFTSPSNNVLLKTITDHINAKMTDEEILNYVIHLRTHSNLIFNLNDIQIKEALNNYKADSKSYQGSNSNEVFKNVLDNNSNIDISDVAELYTFNYPAYENDAVFLFWITLDFEKKGIVTYNQFMEEYDLQEKYGIIDLGSRELINGILKYFIEHGDAKSEELLKEYASNDTSK